MGKRLEDLIFEVCSTCGCLAENGTVSKYLLSHERKPFEGGDSPTLCGGKQEVEVVI